jgi:hypothetical protein
MLQKALLLRMGTEDFTEDGLGAAHRLPAGIGCDGYARNSG